MTGSLVILESETGSGKTEAAMAHALKLYRAGAIDGVFFGLPTRTSGVQMHARVTRMVQHAFGEQHPPVVLAVPGYTRVDDNNGVLLPHHQVRWDDDQDGDLAFRGWYAEGAKRFLSAPFAVGTIDQALMSVLRAKHAHLRAASLTRQLLVIDEVHASDAYMTELTSALVRTHVSEGGHAFLMSATLGSAAAARYLGTKVPSFPEARAMPYPLLRVRDGAGPVPRALSPAGEGDTSKTVIMDIAPTINRADAVADLAATHARNGAKVLVIRNTVGACIEVRGRLSAELPSEMVFGIQGTPACHHGRYAPEDRTALDHQVEVALGRDSNRGDGLVLVATQTVEQSLDIDADILITDLCPMDVLLQRLGRLHRHQRDVRPAGYAQPRCIVLTPERGTLPYLKKAADGIGRDRAYSDVRVIELTLRQILQLGHFVIPAMNRALVEGAVHPEALKALDGEDQVWRKHGMLASIGNRTDGTTARSAMAATDAYFADPELSAGWGDAGQGSTRLGQLPLSVLFPSDDRPVGPFKGEGGRVVRIPMIALPWWMVPKVLQENPSLDCRPEGVLELPQGGFDFMVAGDRFRYDQDGLSKLPKT